MIMPHKSVFVLLGVIFAILLLASVIALVLRATQKDPKSREVIDNLLARIKAWWIMCIVFVVATMIGRMGSIVLFSLMSFAALREFITLTPTKPSDHRTLFWAFFIILPFHYYYLSLPWEAMFIIFIPVYAFIFLPIRTVINGDYERFLERTAKIQWGLMVCVYCLSYAPALLTINIPGYEGRSVLLLFFMVFVVQISDVFQYVFGKLWGKTKIAPHISPNKTVEGFVGGVTTAVILGTFMWRMTPFSLPETAGYAFLLTLTGFFGGLIMSAIKRDRGVKDYGTAIAGHGGMLDRIDSLCFSAPIFYHLVRYFYT